MGALTTPRHHVIRGELDGAEFHETTDDEQDARARWDAWAVIRDGGIGTGWASWSIDRQLVGYVTSPGYVRPICRSAPIVWHAQEVPPRPVELNAPSGPGAQSMNGSRG